MTDGRRRARILVAAGLFVLIAGGFAAFHEVQSALLRSDPNAIPSHANLMAFAVFEGRGVYATHCAGCHGVSGKGDRARGVPNLTDNDWLYGSGRVSEIEQVIDFGIRAHNPKTQNLAEMPAFARAVPSAMESKIPPLAPGDIRDVVEFLRHVEGRSADPEAVKRGSAIYHERGGCYDCHGQDGSGDNAIGAPNLTDNIWLYGDGNRASMFESIGRGHAGVCPAWIGKLKPAAVREAALYAFSLSRGSKGRRS
jgi:cytochrome c oxidase cbb3-type subunit 3